MTRFTRGPMRRHVLAGLAAMLAGLPAGVALAQAGGFPNKPIRIIVNNAPGGAVDVVARTIGQPLQEALGQPVVIENRGGAGGLLGGEAVAKAAADGYTLLCTAGSMVVISPHLQRNLPFDPEKLVPVAAAGRATLFLLARPDVPARTVDELVRHMKANPGRLSFGSAGNGSSLHIAGEMFKSQTGTFAVHVPYRGASPAIQDLLAKNLDFVFDSGTGLEQVRAGKLRLLAVANKARSSMFPDTPTMEQAGIQGFDAGSSYGFLAPAGTPPEVVARLNTEINKILAQKSVRERLMAIGAEPTPMSAAEFRTVLADDSRRFGAIIRERKITIE